MLDTIGSRIRELRLNHAPKPYTFSLRAFANQLDVNYIYLSQLETGKRENPSARLLFKIAQALGTTVEFLLTGKGGEDAPR